MSHAADLYPFDLGDRRLNRRAARLVQAALDNPGASIPAAAGARAAADATYRFLDNPDVRPEGLDAAHRRHTLDRLAGTEGPVRLAQDTTPLDFTSPARNHALGQLAHARHFGFFAHSALALTEDGRPLGLLHQHVWARPPEQRGQRQQRRHKGTADKESQRRLDTEAACAAARPPGRTAVTIGDREADCYDYFAAPRRPGQHALVRARPRRRLAGSKELLGAAVRAGPPRGAWAVAVPRKDGRPGRRAALALRYGTFALRPPSTHPRRQALPPLPLPAVLAEGADPPAGAAPVRWLLRTTRPVASLADAARLVRWYTYRWRVERYHFVLKSGCQPEELQREAAARLRRALALYALVAARLLHLT